MKLCSSGLTSIDHIKRYEVEKTNLQGCAQIVSRLNLCFLEEVFDGRLILLQPLLRGGSGRLRFPFLLVQFTFLPLDRNI